MATRLWSPWLHAQALAHFPNSKFAKAASRRKKTIQEYDAGCGVLPFERLGCSASLKARAEEGTCATLLAQHHLENRVLLPTVAAAAAGVLSAAVAGPLIECLSSHTGEQYGERDLHGDASHRAGDR